MTAARHGTRARYTARLRLRRLHRSEHPVHASCPDADQFRGQP